MGEVVAFPRHERPAQGGSCCPPARLNGWYRRASRGRLRKTSALDRFLCRLGRHSYRFLPDPGWSPFSADPPECVRLCQHCLCWPPEAAPVRRAGLVAIVCAALTACATTQKAAPVVVCLPAKVYTPEQEKAAAAALQALPNGSILAQMAIDYGAMRSANRAACTQPAE